MASRRDFLKNTIAVSTAMQMPWLARGTSQLKPLTAKIPSSGQEVLRVGLGTYKVFDVGGDATKRKDLSEVLKIFFSSGGTLIDSSPMYNTSEEVVGDLTSTLKLNAFMATKVWIEGREAGIKQMQESLRRLHRDKIELMQIHNLVDWKTQVATLRKWKEEGKFRYIGITHHTSSAFSELERVMQSETLDFVQIPYSLAERAAEKSLIPLAAKRRMAVIANEPFDQGGLFQRVKGKDLPSWAKDNGISSWAQYFLKFILSNENCQFAIPGTGRIDHMKDNIAAAFGELPNSALRDKMLKLP